MRKYVYMLLITILGALASGCNPDTNSSSDGANWDGATWNDKNWK